MSKMKKLISLLLVVAMVLSMAVMFAGCKGEEEPEATKSTTKSDEQSNTPDSGESDNTQPGENVTYTVSVVTAGGMKMSGINVYVYADSNKTDLVTYGQTDADGLVSLSMPKSDDYAIELQGVPKGYAVESSYAFTGNVAVISLNSALITDKTLSDLSAATPLGLGDVMYDFTVKTSAGEEITLSKVLAENKMVLLNFWYSTCGPCVNEFPYMNEGYNLYKDKGGAVIAINPMDDANTVANFKGSMALDFNMASCPATWSQIFNVTGYPTSLVIDRYGVICLIEVGGITNLSPFTSIFEYFTADDYQQKLCANGVSDIMTKVKPDVTMDSTEDISSIINKGEIEVTYRAEADDEYCWPFILGDKDGTACLMSSNDKIESSYAIIYADVTLKAGQAVGFDYLISSEYGADVLHVIVDDEPIFTISGADEKQAWKSCYPCVATKDGTYEIALCYIKDESNDVGDDTVYIKDMRVVDASQIDTTAHLPRQAATTEDGFTYSYVDVVLNEKDGYYHVGTKDGPLLLVDMMGYTEFSEEQTLWDITYDSGLKVDGVDLHEALTEFYSYGSNSSLSGVCTVNKDLAELLKKVADVAGFEDDENEWLKMCKYYQAYGKDAKQMEDPIKGLATFSAYEAKLGKNVSTNFFYYNTAIIPRGKLAKFVPSKSGVYRITSRAESSNGVDGWIFDGNRKELLIYEMDERLWNDSSNVSMLYYMKAGEAYYIDIAFWDVYEVGYIYYDIEYVASSMELFRLCSPGYFTYDTNATGDAMYHLIAGGIDVVMGNDGYYHEDLGKDANGKQRYGSIIYADFTGVTSLFSNPIVTVDAYDENGKLVKDENGNVVKIKGMIDMGGFDFSKNEEDLYILGIMEKYNNDLEATRAYLKETWADDYDENAALYMIDDVFAGKYHGTGPDLTVEIKAYQSKMYSGSAKERVGCVPVDARLAEILQMLMEKYTFENVDNAWIKLCYYYDTIGPNG
ncbi:MAG: redoxin domain-containing protein [Ruminococcaceae bacterium]|nr:redoxin domain-containing protein [Oscillospiraceae bacterium]